MNNKKRGSKPTKVIKEEMSVPLPKNVSLLSDQELDDLMKNHQSSLGQYVKQFHSDQIDHVINETKSQQFQLKNIRDQYISLENDRTQVKKEIDSIKSLYEEYSNKYHSVQARYQNDYSEYSFKRRLSQNIKQLDDESNVTKLQILALQNVDQLDQLLQQYEQQRVSYHTSKEQFTTWEEQGSLRR